MDSSTAHNSSIAPICWSRVCNGECGSIHPDTNVPERVVHWSWLPAAPKPRYMGQWWSRGGVDSLMHASGRGDLDVDDMSNES